MTTPLGPARLESERVCWAVLGFAIALSAGLGLWFTRGATFFADELTYFVANRGFDFRVLVSGHNGHLIAVTRLIYAAGLQLFGADYLVFRLLEVIGIAIAAGLFYVIAKRRIGAAAALAPSIVLLYLGAGAEVTLTPLGITHVYSVVTGLGALLALERNDRRGDVGACVLLSVSVATFSIGLAFTAGVAVSILLSQGRWRRAWVFLVPLALYCAWFLAAPELTGPAFSKRSGVLASNVLMIPSFVADAAASAVTGITGLGYFSLPPSDTISSVWGSVIVGLAVVVLVLRLRQGMVAPAMWASVAIALGFWIPIALTEPGRPPGAIRYIYAGSVALLLIATDAARGVRFSRTGLLALFAATIAALGANVAQLRDMGVTLRTSGAQLRAQVTAIEVARDHVEPNFLPSSGPLGSITLNPSLAARAGSLLAEVDRVGSFGFSQSELLHQPEPVRELADSTLAGALRIGLAPLAGRFTGQRCTLVGGHPGVAVRLSFRPPGVVLRSAVQQPVILGRFATQPAAIAGLLAPGRFEVLAIPADRATEPWHAAFQAADRLAICPLAGA